MEFTEASLLKEAKSFHAKKRLGQHFLVSPEALRCVADSLDATASDTIIEIGPGIGFLTRLLTQTGARIVAVDLDRESIGELQLQNLPNVELMHGDILRFDFNSLQFYRKQNEHTVEPAAGRIKVVGNVPYQITGLILGHLLGEVDKTSAWLGRIDRIVIMVQREVAERMVAKAGSDAYSKVSLLVSYFAEASIEMIVPPNAFSPPPEVTSAIVKLIPHKKPPIEVSDRHLLKQVIDAGFRQRRKMLRNGLSFLRLPQETINQIFKTLSIDPQVRAERLSLQQFAMLTDAINEQLQKHAQDKSPGTSES